MIAGHIEQVARGFENVTDQYIYEAGGMIAAGKFTMPGDKSGEREYTVEKYE